MGLILARFVSAYVPFTDITSAKISSGATICLATGGVTGEVYYSADSGSTWFLKAVLNNTNINSVAIATSPSFTAYAVGNTLDSNKYAVIYSSTDYATWTAIRTFSELGTSQTVSSVATSSGYPVFAAISSGSIYQSDDSGASWLSIFSDSAVTLYGMSMYSNIGRITLIVAAKSTASSTLGVVSAGNVAPGVPLSLTFKAIAALGASVFSFAPHSVSVADLLDAYVVAYSPSSQTGVIYRTTNGGSVWSSDYSVSTTPLFTIAMHNSYMGVAGGASQNTFVRAAGTVQLYFK